MKTYIIIAVIYASKAKQSKQDFLDYPWEYKQF